MLIKKLYCATILCIAMTPIFALTPKDPKYCTMLKQLKPKMDIGDVFLLMGPPHSFGQPPNLEVQSLSAAQPPMQPQTTISQNNAATRAQILKSMANDPILGAFMKAPPDSKNVLIWTFEDDTLSVSVQVKGPTVTNVKANFSCK